MFERYSLWIINTGIMSVYRLKTCYDRYLYQIYTTENIVEKIKSIQETYDTYHTSERLNEFREEAECLVQIICSLHFPYWDFMYDTTVVYNRGFLFRQIKCLMGKLYIFDQNINNFCKKIKEFVVILDNQPRVVRIILKNPPPRDIRLIPVLKDITSQRNIELDQLFE